MRRARDMAKKRGYRISVKRFKSSGSVPHITKKSLARYQTSKMRGSVERYVDWCEHNTSRLKFTIWKGDKEITNHLFDIVDTAPPTSVKKALRTIEEHKQTFSDEEIIKTQGWYLRLQQLPFIHINPVRVIYGDESILVHKNYTLGRADNLLEKPFRPFADSLGGGSMAEEEKKTGVYSILKMYEAGWAEKHQIELFSEANNFTRTDMYRSYGWLSNFDYTEWTPYESSAAKSFLAVGNFEAAVDFVWRPVWAKEKARLILGKELIEKKNPGWRHGEQMEDDPFAEYFEENVEGVENVSEE